MLAHRFNHIQFSSVQLLELVQASAKANHAYSTHRIIVITVSHSTLNLFGHTADAGAPIASPNLEVPQFSNTVQFQMATPVFDGADRKPFHGRPPRGVAWIEVEYGL